MKLSASACAVASVLLLAACGGGGRPRTPTPIPPTRTPAPDRTIRPISDDQLSRMTLSLEDLGARYATYQPAQTTGPATLDARSSPDCGPQERDTLVRLGWERGYDRDWVRSDFSNDDNVAIGTTIDVYRDAAAAHERFLSDSDPLHGIALCDGVTSIENVSEFGVSTTGDEAHGLRITYLRNGLRYTITWAFFRRGRILGLADVIRLDRTDSDDQAVEEARKLDARIVDILTREPSGLN